MREDQCHVFAKKITYILHESIVKSRFKLVLGKIHQETCEQFIKMHNRILPTKEIH